MAETRERPEWIGGLISFLRGHAHAYSSESKERAQLERYIERLATLSTPREPEGDKEALAEAIKVTVLTHFGGTKTVHIGQRYERLQADYTPDQWPAVWESIAEDVLARVNLPSPSPYTDEDGHQRCHLGGCRVELVDEDEGTCYYRVVGEGDE